MTSASSWLDSPPAEVARLATARDRTKHPEAVPLTPEDGPPFDFVRAPEDVERETADYIAEAAQTRARLDELDPFLIDEPDVIPAEDWPAAIAEPAYHGLAGVIVRALAPYTEADPVGLLGSFLAVFATLAGKGWGLHQGDWQQPSLFITLVGDTSDGRKGSAYGPIREVFKLADPDWSAVLVAGLGSGEGLITCLRDRESNPRALIHEDEFGRLLIAMTREGATLSQIIRNAWDGNPLGRHVANLQQSGQVDRHHVGLLANITKVELAQRLTSVDAADGFGNRFLWLAVRRSRRLPFTEPVTAHVSPFLPGLKAALHYAERGGIMEYTPEARDYWRTFYMNRVPRPGLIGRLTARAEPYVARLAMVYALLDQTDRITVDHLAAGEAIVAYAERSAIYIFGDSTGDRNADALLVLLRDQSPIGWLEARRELGIRSAAELDAVVRLLERFGLVRLIRVARAGRARREIELVG